MSQKQSIGDYELLNEIGRDPLGIIYHAQHKFLKRYFALRILPEDLAQVEGFVKRFEAGVAALAGIESEDVAKIHTVGMDSGRAYIVSDLVLDQHGQYTTLGQYLDQEGSNLDEESVFTILYQVARGLDVLHGKSIVHRYLNLHTILVGKQEDGVVSVKIQDAGVAAILGESALLTRGYESLAQQLGENSADAMQSYFRSAYPYLAPEQKAVGAQVDIKADTYAFGVMAYKCLMGRVPEGFFALPSNKSGYKHDWDALLFHCLASDGRRRPAALAAALQEIKESRTGAHTDAVDGWKKGQSVTIDEQAREMSGGSKPVSPPVVKDEPVAQEAPKSTSTKPVNTSIQDIVAEISEEKAQRESAAQKKSGIESNISLNPQAQAIRYSQATAVMDVEEEQELKPKINPGTIEKPEYDDDPAAVFQVDHTVSTYKPAEKESIVRTPIPTDMVVIPGGEYHRGSNEGARDERPYHKVYLKSYAIDEHPVTNEQFVRFLDVMGGEKDANNNDIIRLRESRIKRSAGRLIIESGYAKHPVVGVTWYGAVAYAKWTGKRLPTEAEWEVAASSMEGDKLYPTGEAIERDQANFFGSDTTLVKSFPPNGIGLYDMAGNVYEWCQDWYDYAYYETSMIEPDNPTGPVQGVYRVLRGGCWKSLIEDLRCSHRNRNNPGAINSTYGFRCASDVVTE